MSVGRLALTCALVLTACSDLSRPSGPGTLTATLYSPYGDEGAAVLLLVGEGVGEVRPAAGDTEVYAVVSGEQTRVVLIDQSGGTLAFDVAMTDMTRPLTAIVQEVAGPDDRLRGDLSDYRVLLAR